jgi:hypothetical protein
MVPVHTVVIRSQEENGELRLCAGTSSSSSGEESRLSGNLSPLLRRWFAGGNHESPLLVEAEHLAVGKLVQGLIKPEGEDEGILVDAWSAAAFGGRIEARQSGQECDDQRVDGGKRQFISSHEQRSIKQVAEKEKPFLQQALSPVWYGSAIGLEESASTPSGIPS